MSVVFNLFNICFMKKMVVLLLVSSLINCMLVAQDQTAIEVSDDVLLELYNGARVADVVDAIDRKSTRLNSSH